MLFIIVKHKQVIKRYKQVTTFTVNGIYKKCFSLFINHIVSNKMVSRFHIIEHPNKQARDWIAESMFSRFYGLISHTNETQKLDFQKSK